MHTDKKENTVLVLKYVVKLTLQEIIKLYWGFDDFINQNMVILVAYFTWLYYDFYDL